MAKQYIKRLLSDALGRYLDGLESTQLHFGVTEARLNMENVKIKQNALTQLKLPIEIQFGLIKELRVRVPWLSITSCPVEVHLKGMDLIVTPQEHNSWEFTDIYSQAYLESVVTNIANEIRSKITEEFQQGYFDRIKIKILDNLLITIEDVHFRVEETVDTNPSTFGFMMQKFEILTVDDQGNKIFHDRTVQSNKIIKVLNWQNFCIYLNPRDNLIIHKIAKAGGKYVNEDDLNADELLVFKAQEIKAFQSYLDTVVASYHSRFVQTGKKVKEETGLVKTSQLEYILKPMSLTVKLERFLLPPLQMKFTIQLEQFEIYMEQRQLNAILKFGKLAQQYQKAASFQEKLRKFRVYRPIQEPGIKNFNARAWWKFAYKCIKTSFQAKKGTVASLSAFKLGRKDLDEMSVTFKSQFKQIYLAPDETAVRNIINKKWSKLANATFWHIVAVTDADRLRTWVSDIVTPVERKKLEMGKAQKEKASKQSLLAGWFSSKTPDDDDMEAFFRDINETEGEESSSYLRENTSLYITFKVNQFSVTLGKEGQKDDRKIEGIQIYSIGTQMSLESPTLKIQRFKLNQRIEEWGISLITLNRKTNLIEDCTQVIMTNKAQLQQTVGQSNLAQEEIPAQWDLQITKNDPLLADQGIEYDVALQIGSVVFKYFEDLLVRGRAIFQIKIDKEISASAASSFDDLKESTQSRFHDMIYRRKNRYVVSIQSPVFILPIRGTFDAKFSPVWVIRTGDMLIISANLNGDDQLLKKAKVLTKQQQICPNGEEVPSFEVNDFYEGYRVSITSIGLQYFCSNKLYEQTYCINQIGQKPVKSEKIPSRLNNLLQSPISRDKTEKSPKFKDKVIEQPINVQDKVKNQQDKEKILKQQSLQYFSVLENFEIKILIKMKKKVNAAHDLNAQELHRFMPTTAVSVCTNVIKINLSHYIYNQLVNLAKIFKISEEKRAEHERNVSIKHISKKKGILKTALLQAQAQRKNYPNVKDLRTYHWQRVFIVLTNTRIYMYPDKNAYVSLLVLQLTEISRFATKVTDQEFLITLELKLTSNHLSPDGNLMLNFQSKQEMQSWLSTMLTLHKDLSKDIFGAKEVSKSFDVRMSQQRASKEKVKFKQSVSGVAMQELARQQTLKNLTEQQKTAVAIQTDFTLSLPVFKINLLKLNLNDANSYGYCFQEWVSLEIHDMNLSRVSRLYDSTLHVSLKRITLTDLTMVSNRTLLFQEIAPKRNGMRKQLALQVVEESQQEESPRFNGLLSYRYIELADIKFNFMPNTINKILKFFRATRLSTKPVNDSFMVVSEYPNDFKPPSVIQESQQSTEQEDQTTVFETDCLRDQTQTSKMIVVVKGVQLGMLHPKYEMELFRLETTRLELEMQSWYDHSQFGLKLQSTTLSDVTGYPYTVNPRLYFEEMKSSKTTVQVPKPFPLFQFSHFNLMLESYSSHNCPKKPKDFSNKLEIRISPLVMNYMQEQVFRFIDYFQEQFIDSLVLADPYLDPQSKFQELQQRKTINLNQISERMDFKQPAQIGMMDIKVTTLELKIRDRPQSKSYLLISIPQVEVSQVQSKKRGKFARKPEIELKTQILTVKLEEAMFWYCYQTDQGFSQIAGNDLKHKYALLQKHFSITVDIENLCGSEVIEKINLRDLDKSGSIDISFDPVLFMLHQQIYTYILRCSDLNFTYSDKLQEEFFFAKWKQAQSKESANRFANIVQSRIAINIPALSLSLKSNDNSYLAELILQDFQYQMARYMDGASDMTIKCKKFFILDQYSQQQLNQRASDARATAGFREKQTTVPRETFAPDSKLASLAKEDGQQAIICPINWPINVRSKDIIGMQASHFMDNETWQFSVNMNMMPNGDKYINLRIECLKIFTKLQLFIKLQTFFTTAFPKYDENSLDKPTGFTTDPDLSPKMSIRVEIVDSLICLLNRPGFKSIACQGNIFFEQTNECIGTKKKLYEKALIKMRDQQENEGFDFDGKSRTASKLDDEMISYFEEASLLSTMKIKLSQFTPFICSLSHLESSNSSFKNIKKRQLMQPLDISMEVQTKICKYHSEVLLMNVDLNPTPEVHKTPQLGHKQSPLLELSSQRKNSSFVQAQEEFEIQPEGQLKTEMEWGVNTFSQINVGRTKVKISLQDIALIMQITSYSNEQMTLETVQKLHEIKEKIEQKDADEDSKKSEVKVAQEIGEVGQKMEVFHDYLQKIGEEEQPGHSVSDQVKRFSSTVRRFTLVTQGQAKNRLSNKKKFLDFLKTEVLKDNPSSQADTSNDEDIREEQTQLENIRRRTINQGYQKRQKKQNSQWKDRDMQTEVEEIESSQEEDSPIKPSKRKHKIESDEDQEETKGGSVGEQEQKVNAPVTFFDQADDSQLSPSKRHKSPSEKIDRSRQESIYKSTTSNFPSQEKFSQRTRSIQVQDGSSDLFYSFVDGESRDSLKGNFLSGQATNGMDGIELVKQSFQENSRATIREKAKPPSIYDKVRKTTRIVTCDDITILMINDFDKAFTPVVELTVLDIMVTAASDESLKTSQQDISLQSMTAAYYNLELSEWEPMLEKLSCNIKIETTEQDLLTMVDFEKPIFLNVTESSLHNIINTYQSWIASPDYIFGSTFKSSQLQASSELKADEALDQQQAIQGWLISEESQMDTVTPFQIMNQTQMHLTVVCGGIKSRENQSKSMIERSDDKVHLLRSDSIMKQQREQIKDSILESVIGIKQYKLAPGSQCDYAVKSQQLSQNQLTNEYSKQQSRIFKTNEIVGLQFHNDDVVREVDLNEISHVNPFIFKLSNRAPLVYEEQKFNYSLALADSQPEYLLHPIDPIKESKKPIRLNKLKQKRNEDWRSADNLVYGVQIKKMRKVLVIRTPYVFNNRTKFTYDIRIIKIDQNKEVQRFKLVPDSKYALDFEYYQVQLEFGFQVKGIFDEKHYQINAQGTLLNANDSPGTMTNPRTRQSPDAGFSQILAITDLLKLNLNGGSGLALVTKESDGLCTCIKKMTGELKETIDFVLLPPLIIKNALPCHIEVIGDILSNEIPQNSISSLDDLEQGDILKPKKLMADKIEKSEEKHFYLFMPHQVQSIVTNKTQKDMNPILVMGYSLQFSIGGFLYLPDTRKATFEQQRPDEVPLDLVDDKGNSLQIRIRVQHDRAGYHLTLFADTIIAVETVRLLNNRNISIQYEQSYREILQRTTARRLAGSSELESQRFLLCSPNQKITVGITPDDGEPFISQPLDFTGANGGQIEFSVMTQHLEKVRKRGDKGASFTNQKFDLVATQTISLADYQESIYTKIILISPKYVLVNNLRSVIELGQPQPNESQTINKIMAVGDKSEWYWPNSNAPELIVFRVQSSLPDLSLFSEEDLLIESNKSSFSIQDPVEQTDKPQLLDVEENVDNRRGSKFRTTKYEESVFEEGKQDQDDNVQWAWSRGISLGLEKQMIMAVMVREMTSDNELKRTFKTKTIRVSKKKVNGTIFIIFDEEDLRYPMYRIVNECENVKVNFCQLSLIHEMKPDMIEPHRSQSFGFYEPAGSKQVQLTIEINKNCVTALTELEHRYVSRNDIWFTKQELFDFDCVANFTREIEFTSIFQEKHRIILDFNNDGQTKTLRFKKIILVDEFNAFKSKQKKMAEGGLPLTVSKSSKSKEGQLRVVYKLELNKFCISIIGKVQEFQDDQIVLIRKELALMTLKGLKIYSDQKQATGHHDLDVAIQHFQIDNQTELNPLFQQIFVPKVYVGRGMLPRTGRLANMQNQFLILSVQSQTNKDTNVTIVEKFDMRLAELAFQLDDEFLNDLTFFVFSITDKLDVGISGMHPMFLKGSHFDQLDQKTELVNRNTLAITMQSIKSSVEIKKSIKDKTSLKQGVKQHGVVLINEKVNTKGLAEFANHERKWYQQDIAKTQGKLYVKQFLIEHINAEISFIFKTKASKDINFAGPLRYLKIGGLSLINIDEANFKLLRLNKQNIYIGSQDFRDLISDYYTARVIREVKKLALSIGFFGSPRTLIKHFRDGAHDFIDLPAEGIRDRGIRGGVVGFGYGLLSLTKNVGVGTCQSLQALNNSVSQAVLLLSQDKDYARERQSNLLVENPKNFVEGFGYGCQAAINSVGSAAIGPIYRPFVEARREGVHGLIYGLYQGSTGLVLKPISGVFDLFSKSAQGVKNTIRALEKRQRRDRIRYPRPFYGQNRLIKPFSDDDALLVNCVLSQIYEGQYVSDHYLEMKLIKPAEMNPHFLLLTQEHLFFIEAAQKALVWHIRTKLIQDVQIMKNGILIRLAKVYNGREQVGLPLDDNSSIEVAQWLNAIATEFI